MISRSIKFNFFTIMKFISIIFTKWISLKNVILPSWNKSFLKFFVKADRGSALCFEKWQFAENLTALAERRKILSERNFPVLSPSWKHASLRPSDRNFLIVNWLQIWLGKLTQYIPIEYYRDTLKPTLGCQIDEYTRLFGTKETWRKKQTQRQTKVFNKNPPYSFIWPYSFNWHLRVLFVL